MVQVTRKKRRWSPRQKAIQKACEELQKSWSLEERRHRAGLRKEMPAVEFVAVSTSEYELEPCRDYL